MHAHHRVHIEIDEGVGVHEQKRVFRLEMALDFLQATGGAEKLRLNGPMDGKFRGRAPRETASPFPGDGAS